jgi:hypothetical protein
VLALGDLPSVHSAQVAGCWPVLVSADALPFARAQFDLVTCGTPAVDDLYMFALAVWHVLKPGGWMQVHTTTLPNDDRAAHYLNAFYQVRDQQRFFPEYQWQGALLDAGFAHVQSQVLASAIEPAVPDSCSGYVAERLPVLLTQAPAAVKDWLQPRAIGTSEATVMRRLVRLIGQKPL